jgi:hypothetical protein
MCHKLGLTARKYHERAASFVESTETQRDADDHLHDRRIETDSARRSSDVGRGDQALADPISQGNLIHVTRSD